MCEPEEGQDTGTLRTPGRLDYRTSAGQVQDKYRTSIGQLQDNYRTPTGHTP